MKYDEIRSKALEVKKMNIKNVQIDVCTFSSDLNTTIDSLIFITDNLFERYKKTGRGRIIAEAYRDNLKKIVTKFCVTENK